MKTVKEQIFSFLQSNPTVFHGGYLQRKDFKTRKGGLASGDNIKRRLNELVEEGKLDVTYKNGQAHFCIKGEHRKLKQIVTELPNGSVRIDYVPV